MPVLWPDGGPWALATTSSAVDWQPAAAALAAASTVRAAAVVFGADERPGALLLGELATFLQAGDGSADPFSVDEAAALVGTLSRTHGLVLMVGGPGLLVPVGRAGWTLMDLAVAVAAPVVMVTGTGPDSANHTSLALGAVSGHGLAGTVITVGDPAGTGLPAAPGGAAADEPAPAGDAARADDAPPDDDAGPAGDSGLVGDSGLAGAGRLVGDSGPAGDSGRVVVDHEAGMPVVPAGRIPGDVGVRGESLAGAARQWLHPVLHASAGRRKADTPPPPPQPLPPPATAGGKRVVLLLAGVFVSMSLVVCGLAFCGGDGAERTEARLFATAMPPPADPRPRLDGDGFASGLDADADAVPEPGPAVGDVCRQHRGGVTPAVPDRATTSRVNAAWKRIEVWLAAHAPASRRSLRPPAAAKEIDAAQRRMSVAFPADLVASLRRHDGATGSGNGFVLPYFYGPMPVREIVPEWLSLCTSLVEVFGAEQDSSWWDRSFVPFASSGDGGDLLVDQRPGNHGRVGEFYNEDGVSFEQWPGSVAELLEQTAQSLESGRPFANGYRPKVTRAGVLEWDVLRSAGP